MSRFILNQNQQANGDNEVHNLTTGCLFMPAPANRLDLGEHWSCNEAVTLAKLTFPLLKRINGCLYCCPACHVS